MYTRARALVILHLRGSPAGPYNPAPSTIMGRTRLHLPVAWVLIMASVLALFAKTVSPMSPVADIPSTPLSFTSVVPEAPTTDATPTARHSLTVVTPASHVFVVAAPTSRASIVGPLASTASFIFVFSSSAWTSSRASVVELPGSTQFGAPGPPFLGPTSTPGTRTDTFTVGDVAWRQIPAALVSATSASRASVVSSSASSSARTSVSATFAQRMPAAGLAPTASRVFRQRRVHVAHMWRRLRIDGGARLRHHCARFAHVRRRLVRGLPVSPAFFDPTLQDPPSLHELFGGRSNTSWISTTSVAFFRTARIEHVIQLGVLTPSLLRRRNGASFPLRTFSSDSSSHVIDSLRARSSTSQLPSPFTLTMRL